MAPAAREWKGMGTEIRYECPECGHAVSFMPDGAIGAGVLMWILASSVVTAFFLYDKFGPGIIGWTIIALFWLGGGAVYAVDMHRRLRYPVTGAANSAELPKFKSGAPLRRAIGCIERLGFLGAPLVILAIMLAFLAIAVAIGFIGEALSN